MKANRKSPPSALEIMAGMSQADRDAIYNAFHDADMLPRYDGQLAYRNEAGYQALYKLLRHYLPVHSIDDIYRHTSRGDGWLTEARYLELKMTLPQRIADQLD